MGTLEPGDMAPDFRLPAGNSEVTLSSLRGCKVVLYFFPKADTPGCTLETLDFSGLRDRFAEIGTQIVGVSADPLKVQQRFQTKHGIAFPLASDPEHKTLEVYGVWREKQMYGRKFMGIVRSTFLIDPEGRIARVWRNVKVPGHAEEVLAVAQDL
jgi:thioredoxin-dependent peroxiredoxin